MDGRRGPALRAAATCALAVAGLQLAPAAAAGSETLMLDAHGRAGVSVNGPVASGPLDTGAQYYARVTGTASIYEIGSWTVSRAPCGTPEAIPLHPSVGVKNGAVGMDAETVFGIPAYAAFHGYSCSVRKFPFRLARYTDGGLQFSQGGAFARPVPVGGPREVPRADHTYLYAFTGTGGPLLARWVDRPMDDDYGQFRIEILTAAECAAQRCLEAADAGNDQDLDRDRPRPLLGNGRRGCVSRRNFRIRVRTYRGVEIKSATLYVRGKTIAMIRDGVRLRASVDLRGLPYGVYRVRMVAVTTRGQKLLDDRRYKTCRIKRPKAKTLRAASG